MIYGKYLRVSTSEQDTASQEHAIQAWLAPRLTAGDTVISFVDHGISGTNDDRPSYRALCDAVAAGKVDAVVVYRLDRLSRNAVTALRLLMDWLQNDVAFFAVDQPVLHLGKENPMRLTIAAMMAEISEIERQTIVSRVKAGLAAARARGVKLGGTPKLTAIQQAEVRELRTQGLPLRVIARRFGVAHSMIARICAAK